MGVEEGPRRGCRGRSRSCRRGRRSRKNAMKLRRMADTQAWSALPSRMQGSFGCLARGTRLQIEVRALRKEQQRQQRHVSGTIFESLHHRASERTLPKHCTPAGQFAKCRRQLQRLQSMPHARNIRKTGPQPCRLSIQIWTWPYTMKNTAVFDASCHCTFAAPINPVATSEHSLHRSSNTRTNRLTYLMQVSSSGHGRHSVLASAMELLAARHSRVAKMTHSSE